MKDYWFLLKKYNRFFYKHNRIAFLIVLPLAVLTLYLLISNQLYFSNQKLLSTTLLIHFLCIIFFKTQSWQQHPLRLLKYFPLNPYKIHLFFSLITVFDFIFLLMAPVYLYLIYQVITTVGNVSISIAFIFSIYVLVYILHQLAQIIEYVLFGIYTSLKRKPLFSLILTTFLSILSMLAVLKIYNGELNDLISILSAGSPFKYISVMLFKGVKNQQLYLSLEIFVLLFSLAAILFFLNKALFLNDRQRSVSIFKKSKKRKQILNFYAMDPWFIKDLKMLFRSPRFLINIFGFLVLLIPLARSYKKDDIVQMLSFLDMVPLMMLVILGANCFGYENENITGWFMLPLSFDTILKVKTRSYYLFSAPWVLAHFPLLIKYPSQYILILTSLSLCIFFSFCFSRFGLLLSVKFPRRIGYFKIFLNLNMSLTAFFISMVLTMSLLIGIVNVFEFISTNTISPFVLILYVVLLTGQWFLEKPLRKYLKKFFSKNKYHMLIKIGRYY